jgi:hypothetical protein
MKNKTSCCPNSYSTRLRCSYVEAIATKRIVITNPWQWIFSFVRRCCPLSPLRLLPDLNMSNTSLQQLYSPGYMWGLTYYSYLLARRIASWREKALVHKNSVRPPRCIEAPVPRMFSYWILELFRQNGNFKKQYVVQVSMSNMLTLTYNRVSRVVVKNSDS